MCDVQCGGGTQLRHRTVQSGSHYGGEACPSLTEKRACNTQCCPVQCIVSDWSVYDQCTQSCGGGEQSRTRTSPHSPSVAPRNVHR